MVVGRVRVHARQRSRDVAADTAQVGRRQQAQRVQVAFVDAATDRLRRRELAVVVTSDLDRLAVETRDPVHEPSLLRLAHERGEPSRPEPISFATDREPTVDLALDAQRYPVDELRRPRPGGDDHGVESLPDLGYGFDLRLA